MHSKERAISHLFLMILLDIANLLSITNRPDGIMLLVVAIINYS